MSRRGQAQGQRCHRDAREAAGAGRPCTRSTASPLGRPTVTQRMLNSISVHLAQPIVDVVERSLREFDQKNMYVYAESQ